MQGKLKVVNETLHITIVCPLNLLLLCTHTTLSSIIPAHVVKES